MHGIRLLLLCFCFWSSPSMATAQTLSDLRTTATGGVRDLLAQEPATPPKLEGFAESKLDQPLFAPFRREGTLRESSRPAYVITRSQIQAQGARTVQEALRYLPGVLSDGTAGGQLGAQSSQFVRGADSSQVLILLDGRPVNDLGFFGGYDLSELGTDSVERVEVVPGGGSTLYGSDAVGGVINVVTRPIPERPTTSVRTTVGSYGFNQQTLQTSGRSGGVGFRFGYDRLTSVSNFPFTLSPVAFSGTRENAGVAYDNFQGRLEADLDERTSISFNALYQNKDLGVPGGVPYPVLGSVGQFNQLSSDARQFTNNWLLDLGVRSKVGEGGSTLTGRVFADFLNYRFDAPLSQGTRDQIYRQDYGVQLQHNWRVDPTNTLVYGFDWRAVDARNSTFLYSQSTTNLNYDGGINQGAFFLRDEIVPEENLRFNLGVRQDFNSLVGGSYTSPSAGMRWEVGESTTLRANYARSFRSPLISSLYFRLRGFFTVDGNPNLRPESGDSYDIGIDQKLGEDALLRLTGFINDVSDTIAFTFTGPASGSYTNIGRVRTTGLESTLDVKLAENWYLSMNYTLTDPRITADANPSLVGRELSFRGADSLNASLAYEHTGWFTGLFVHSIGSFFTGNDNTESLPGYTTVDLKLRAPLTPGLNFDAQVNNLFNQQYQVYPGYPGLGVNFRTGLSWSI